MRITDFELAYEKLESEMTVCVLSASLYQNRCWQQFNAAAYRVVSITPKEIEFQNINNETEWLSLTPANLATGQFYISY